MNHPDKLFMNSHRNGVGANMSDDTVVKETRRVLRLVQDHLRQAHMRLGSQQEAAGLVDVFHHTSNSLGQLNYVTPRKNTAWVPGPEVQRGIDRLTELKRTPRVLYVEGLYPPLFAKTLRDLGLEMEQEIPLMIYKLPGRAAHSPSLPDGISMRYVDDHEGVAMWWYVWRNAFYDVITRGIELVNIGLEMRGVALDYQRNILMNRHGHAVGAARVTFHQETAHLSTMAIMRELRSNEMQTALLRAAVHAAAERGCELIFTSGSSADDSQLCRSLGFVDYGSMVVYAQPQAQTDEKAHDDTLAQPVFALF